jgi:hypothetical protein
MRQYWSLATQRFGMHGNIRHNRMLNVLISIVSALCVHTAVAQTAGSPLTKESSQVEAPVLEVLKVVTDITKQQAPSSMNFQFRNPARRANEIKVRFRLTPDQAVAGLALENPKGGFFETSPVDDAGKQFARVLGASSDEYAVLQQQDAQSYLLVVGMRASQSQQKVVLILSERLTKDKNGRFTYRVPLDFLETPVENAFAFIEFYGKLVKNVKLHGDLKRGTLSTYGKHRVVYFEARDYRMGEPGEVSWLER